MPDTFTPLSPATLLRKESASIPATGAAPTAFKEFTPAAPATAHAEAGCGKPTVTLQKNTGGVVTSIRVQCGCGSVTELNCVY